MDALNSAIVFLRDIGLSVEAVAALPGDPFLEGVYIDHGNIKVLPACPVGNLLHEAGHLAIVPGFYRNWLNGDIDEGLSQMLDHFEANGDHDGPMGRAVMQCSDPEATAWAWAAGMHLGLRPEQLIGDDDFEDTGREIRMMLAAGGYLGIHGLAAGGMCQIPRRHSPGVSSFPLMTHWLQPARFA